MPQRKTTEADLWAKVVRLSDGCWRWTGTVNRTGYGVVEWAGGTKFIHRVLFVLSGGDLPAKAILRHSCDTPLCVNPQHLLVGTHGDNARDRVERRRSACGEANGRTRLSIENVKTIRESTLPATKLAVILGVHATTVRLVRRGVTWKEA